MVHVRELNLSLTAKEAGYVSLALSRLKDSFTDYISLMESKHVADFDKSEYEVNIGEIETIMKKVERMSDGTR